jgi:hypothetical protein
VRFSRAGRIAGKKIPINHTIVRVPSQPTCDIGSERATKSANPEIAQQSPANKRHWNGETKRGLSLNNAPAHEWES